MSTRSHYFQAPGRRILALGVAILAAGCVSPGAEASQRRHETDAHRLVMDTRCAPRRADHRAGSRTCAKRRVSKSKSHRSTHAGRSSGGLRSVLTATPEPIPAGVAAPGANAGSSGAPAPIPSGSLATGGPPASTPSPPSSLGAGPEWEPELSGISTNGVTEDSIDPKFLTAAPFGTSSFWIQPWRAYLDTWPASRLLDSLGINFNVRAPEAEATAQLLQESGFKLARIGVGWNSLSYEDPSKFVDEANMLVRWRALQRHGIRPLILLNADSTGPAPAKKIVSTTLSAAQAGAQAVALSAASAAEVVPGKTGFDDLTFGGSPDVLITSVGPGNVAKLSRPLLDALPAGEHKGATLLYAPFGPPTLADGEPNPTFHATLDGLAQLRGDGLQGGRERVRSRRL